MKRVTNGLYDGHGKLSVICIKLDEHFAKIGFNIFGSYGFKYIRWSEPRHEASLSSNHDDKWDIDYVFSEFSKTLGAGLSLEKDLLWPMESLDQTAGAAGIEMIQE